MGGSKTTVVEDQTQQTTPQATPEERELNKLQLEQARDIDPLTREINQKGYSLISQLLSGSYNLPGFIGDVGAGIGEDTISSIVGQSLNDVNQSMNQYGLLDSGVRASVGARTAGDIRRQAAEFNIGNRLNLLNLALSGQAQVQQPSLGYSAQLSSRLSGLRSVSQTGTGSSTQSYNPGFYDYYSATMSPLAGGFGQAAGSSFFKGYGSPTVAGG